MLGGITSFQEQASRAPSRVPSWSLTQPGQCTDQGAQALRRGIWLLLIIGHVTSFHLVVFGILPLPFAFCEFVASGNVTDLRESLWDVTSFLLLFLSPLLLSQQWCLADLTEQPCFASRQPSVGGKKEVFSDDPGMTVERPAWEWSELGWAPGTGALSWFPQSPCKSPASQLSRINFHSRVSSNWQLSVENAGVLS